MRTLGRSFARVCTTAVLLGLATLACDVPECSPRSTDYKQCMEARQVLRQAQDELARAVEDGARQAAAEAADRAQEEGKRAASDALTLLWQRLRTGLGIGSSAPLRPTQPTKPAAGEEPVSAGPRPGSRPPVVRVDVPFVPQITERNTTKVFANGTREVTTTGLENCGPASVAMAIQRYRGAGSITLDEAARKIRGSNSSEIVYDAAGNRVRGNGPTSFRAPEAIELLASHGLVLEHTPDLSRILDHVADQHPVLVLVDNRRYVRIEGGTAVPYPATDGWTKEPHIVVIAGYDADAIYINDPLAYTANGKDFRVPRAAFEQAAAARGFFASAVMPRR